MTNPARRWLKRHRASSQIKDAIDGWDEVGGGLVATAGSGNWTVFPIPTGYAPLPADAEDDPE